MKIARIETFLIPGDPRPDAWCSSIPYVFVRLETSCGVMGIVGVPMIDRDPIKLGPEVALCLGHEIAREGADVLHRCSVFGRDDEAKMVTVVLAG